MGLNLEKDFLRIAKCGSVVGLKGEISLWPLSNIEERFKIGSKLNLEVDELLEIEKIRNKKNHFVVKFVGRNSREQVEGLVNRVLYAQPFDDEILDDGEFFIHDFIGKEVIDSKNIARGKVVSTISNPASELLELESGALVPVVFVREIVDSKILLNEPDGLFEINDKD